jgi:hypothetical protein
MTDDRRDASGIPIGTPVVAFDGSSLGQVHEAHPHFLLVRQEGQDEDLEVPANAILAFADGTLQVSANRGAVTEVDDQVTAHRRLEEQS